MKLYRGSEVYRRLVQKAADAWAKFYRTQDPNDYGYAYIVSRSVVLVAENKD